MKNMNVSEKKQRRRSHNWSVQWMELACCSKLFKLSAVDGCAALVDLDIQLIVGECL